MPYLHFIFFILQPLHKFRPLQGCEVNVVYKPPDDGLVKAETYAGVEE
jgi:hypothetical protein